MLLTQTPELLVEGFKPVYFDSNAKAIQAGPQAIQMAEFAYHHYAYSYRDFHVGSTLVAENDVTGETVLLLAGNLKLLQGAEFENQCAERSNLIELNQYNEDLRKRSELIGEQLGKFIPKMSYNVATSNKKDIFEVTDKRTPTLGMCCKCCNDGIHHPLIDPETFISVTLTDSMRHLEVRTLWDYLEEYTSPEDISTVPVSRIVNMDNWQETMQRPYLEARVEIGKAVIDPVAAAQLAKEALLGTIKLAGERTPPSTPNALRNAAYPRLKAVPTPAELDELPVAA